MDLPKPPDVRLYPSLGPALYWKKNQGTLQNDHELKNIVDKLANFVARNGPEFENMTKQKQQDNPKFSFLYGGEHYAYYQYKVQTEQAIINVQNKKLQEQQQAHLQQQQQQAPPQIPTQAPPPQLSIAQLSGPPPPVVNPSVPPPQVTPWASTAPPPVTLTSVPIQQSAPVTLPTAIPPTAVIQTPQQQQVSQLQQQITLQQQQIQQQQQLNEQQIQQSEQNLSAQYASLMQQQQVQIEDAIFSNQTDQLKLLSDEVEIMLDELDKTVQPIIESCTKDAIISGKSWIFQHCANDRQASLIGQYLLKRILAKDASFELRLHLIYLVNDLLHHCQRKNVDNLKACLALIVVPVFCTALVGAGEDKKVKLNKLLTLWEQNKYFDTDTIQKMKEPDQALSAYHAELITKNGPIVAQISASVQLQYQSLQKQHQDFSSHLQSQVQQLQQQLTQLQTQLAQAQAAVITQSIAGPTVTSSAPIVTSQNAIIKSEPDQPTAFQQQSPFGQPPPFGPPPPFTRPPPGSGAPTTAGQSQGQAGGQAGPAGPTGPHPRLPFGDYTGTGPWGGPPPGSGPTTGAPGPFPLPDFSKPPPGFPPPGMPPIPPPDIDLTPSVPYYELPAGLMAPLVKLEDHDYRPLDPRDIRLPPPMPPSERLLAAVEAFYSPPFHDRPRDSEGWEKLGLYEFFKAKQKAKKLKDSRPRSQSRSRSRSSSRSRSVSRSRSQSSSRSQSRSRSSSPKRPSPPRRRRYHSRSRSRSPTKSQSPADSRSPLPYRHASNSPSPPPRRRPPARSRSRSRSRGRSATPPSFSTADFLARAAQVNTNDKLGEENKGHMLMKKMGWGGRGLGAKEQGRVDPVEAGDVRDKQDKFKGVGIGSGDPFEQFRKNKSQGFISRMQARDEMRKEESRKRKDRNKEQDN